MNNALQPHFLRMSATKIMRRFVSPFLCFVAAALVAGCATQSPSSAANPRQKAPVQDKVKATGAPIVYFEVAGPDGARLK